MLGSVGFRKVERISVTPYAAMNRELGVFKWGQTKIDWSGKKQGRGLWHAWR